MADTTKPKSPKAKAPAVPEAAKGDGAKKFKSIAGKSKVRRIRAQIGKLKYKKDLPVVPEAVLKRRKRKAVGKARAIKSQLDQRKKTRTKNIEYFKRAEKYVKEYR